MKITIPFCKVINVGNMSQKNGKIISISLGKDSGFCNVYWMADSKNFEWFNKIKKGDYLYVPSGDMRLSTWINQFGVEKTNLAIFTNFLEILPWKNKDAEKPYYSVDKSSTESEEIDMMFSDLRDRLNENDKAIEGTEMEINKDKWEEEF